MLACRLFKSPSGEVTTLTPSADSHSAWLPLPRQGCREEAGNKADSLNCAMGVQKFPSLNSTHFRIAPHGQTVNGTLCPRTTSTKVLSAPTGLREEGYSPTTFFATAKWRLRPCLGKYVVASTRGRICLRASETHFPIGLEICVSREKGARGTVSRVAKPEMDSPRPAVIGRRYRRGDLKCR